MHARETGGGVLGAALKYRIVYLDYAARRPQNSRVFVEQRSDCENKKSFNIMAMMMLVVMIVAIDGSSISWGRWVRNNLPLFHGLHQVLALGVPNKMDREEARGEQLSALGRLRGF